MNITENLQFKVNHKKYMINKQVSAPNHHQTTIAAYFIESEIKFDKSFHLMVLYENYLICIFMNNYENLKNEGKTVK